VRWVIASAKPALDEEGRVERLLGVIVDVTGQVETATALAESRFHFQTLTEALPQIVWSCDGEGRHDYFSARWSEFTGVSPEDITEDTWTLVDERDREALATAWEHSLATGEPYDIDYRFRHVSGEYRWLRVMALPIRDERGTITRWFGTSTDVHDSYLLAEEREKLASELKRMVTEDQLTGTLTRRAFLERAEGVLAAGHGSDALRLLMLDVDHFKAINDTYGHPVGDKVLAAAAQRVGAAVRQRDFVGRMGGEEFAVLLPHCSHEMTIEIAERIRMSVESHPVILDDGRHVNVTVSVGATCAITGRGGLEALMSVADKALYSAKAGGRNRTRLMASEARASTGI
jgi:diguanylate cyclase (GGDEF)-like protein/PAS domain S-box-containing protein